MCGRSILTQSNFSPVDLLFCVCHVSAEATSGATTTTTIHEQVSGSESVWDVCSTKKLQLTIIEPPNSTFDIPDPLWVGLCPAEAWADNRVVRRVITLRSAGAVLKLHLKLPRFSNSIRICKAHLHICCCCRGPGAPPSSFCIQCNMEQLVAPNMRPCTLGFGPS